MRVVEILEAWEQLEPYPANINYERCRMFSGTPARRYRDYGGTQLGRLVFGRAARRFRIPTGHTVIFSTLGLTPPEPGTPPGKMQERELLSDVIFGLMADYTWSLLAKLPVELPKVITWDEWHTSKDNPRAKYMVDRIKRLGRSRNTVLRLISQSAGDVDPSFVTGIFAFASRDKEEATKTCRLLGVEPSAENVDMVMQLSTDAKGVCLFRDRDGHTARVQVEFLYQFVLDFFDTNPEKDPGKMARIIEDILGAEAAEARRAIDEKDRLEQERAAAETTVEEIPAGAPVAEQDQLLTTNAG
jgi:hypothetical protein